MKTLPMFDDRAVTPVQDKPTRDKPTIITIHAGSGKHISARSLFTHLRDALEGHSLNGETVISITGDGLVIVERNGERELVYQPRRRNGARAF